MEKKKKKGNMLSYQKKKETIKKKTRELSILCDIKACAILVGPNGEVDTWPENPTDFNPIFQSYTRNLFHGKRKVIDDGCLKKKSKKNHALFCNDQWLNDMSIESKESLLVKLNSKLEAVDKRIEFLKIVNHGHWVQETTNVAINGDQVTTSKGKEEVGANQERCNSDSELWGNVELENSMADEFWESLDTLVNQQTLTNNSLKPYSIPLSTGIF